MSETHEEACQNKIDADAGVLKEYILSNGEELYQFLFENPSHLEQLCNLMVMHWDEDDFADTIKQQIEVDLDQECGDKTRQRIYGE